MPESLTQASIDAHSAVGRLVARRPRLILAASLAACALLIAPIAQLTVETDYEVLWLPLSAAQEYAAAKAVLRAAVTPTSAVLRDLPL